jgi:phenylacetate-coenzyme A ligase PaaK-like adenylate-forming protein
MSVIQQLFLITLRETQFATAQAFGAYQLDLLEKIVRHAHDQVPFHRDRLAPLFRGERFLTDNWHDVPLMTRDDIRAQGPALYAPPDPSPSGKFVEDTTTGTTDMPLHYRQSDFVVIASQCQTERMLEVHGIDRTAHKAIIRVGPDKAPYPLGRSGTGWNLTFPWARTSELDIRTTIANQAEWLLRRRPKYLMTYSSNAAAIARTLAAQGAKLDLAAVLTVGETVTEESREEVKRGFGCPIIDSYGSMEAGYLAFQCPAGGGYHLCAESTLVEVVDVDGMPAPAGSLGRVVLTSLYNYAMPFIRYAIGDYAVAAEGPCACGRTLPRLASIAGRSRNVFTFADGSQRAPWNWRTVLLKRFRARELQIVQTALDVIELRYVPLEGIAPPDAAWIAALGKEMIHPAVTMKAVAVEQIPRAPSGKIEDCISLVTP